DRYRTHSWNIDGEFGWKMNFGGFKVTPNIGLRYFHDRRGGVSESGSSYFIKSNTRNYHVLEMPVGVDLGYEINAGGAIIVPRIRGQWIPELSRKRGTWSGEYYDGTQYHSYSEDAARRNRNAFLIGLGLEAKITKALAAHVDYNVKFRSNNYEHHWNVGVGFTF
ncbi:MAG: autotransporter outer membrane beta-barrel domain-containing protein, partial [Planctomycetes bacterium]|nr:autotransporter outer membrane beta-barrel domain-containing protein [Planctomycetota bacterium]